MYLFGVICQARKAREEAINYLVQSVKMYPCHWSAWHDLSKLCTDREEVDKLDLPNHWMKQWFLAHLLLELQKVWCSSLLLPSFLPHQVLLYHS
jgi:anaphase-promoting complex subunit 8